MMKFIIIFLITLPQAFANLNKKDPNLQRPRKDSTQVAHFNSMNSEAQVTGPQKRQCQGDITNSSILSPARHTGQAEERSGVEVEE